MPYITRIQIETCRNVRDLDIDLSVPCEENGAGGPASSVRPQFRHLILTGPNGSGKSGVLDAIARAFTASSGCLSWNVPDGAEVRRQIRAGELLAVFLPSGWNVVRRAVNSSPIAVQGPAKLRIATDDIQPVVGISKQFLQFLVNQKTDAAYAAADGDQATVDHIQGWFDSFERHLRRIMEDDGLVLEFDRRAFDFTFRRSDGYTFDLRTLADGHAAMLGILAELLVRVHVMQDARRDFTFTPEGVIVIDEVEDGLHLSLQEQVLPFLTELFPTLQLIVATHSPAVIASIPNAVVYDLGKRRQVLSDAFRGVRYGTLMTEHIDAVRALFD